MNEERRDNHEWWFRFLDRFGFPVALVVVGILFASGAFSSPITETNDLLKAHVVSTNELGNEVKKVVRLLSIQCVKTANPVDCTLALTEKPSATVQVITPGTVVK